MAILIFGHTDGLGSQTTSFRTLGKSAGHDEAYRVAVDSSGNYYVTGRTNNQGDTTPAILVAKYNSSNAIQWQRVISNDDNCQGYGIDVDSSGDVYIVGEVDSDGITGSGYGNDDVFLAKLNGSNGTINWSKIIGKSAADRGFGIVLDSTDSNIYTTGTVDGAGIFVMKHNTSGTLQWQRFLTGNNAVGRDGIDVDSSDNVYFAGYAHYGGSDWDLIIGKRNSSGVLQWRRRLGGTTNESRPNIVTTSAGNSYVCGVTNSQGSGGTQSALIAKYDTSGNNTWKRVMYDGEDQRFHSLTIDSSENVYAVGFTRSGGDYNVLIAKYNSAGTIQWQRSLGGSFNDVLYDVKLDPAEENLIGVGATISDGQGGGTYYDWFLVKLPVDGSETGTYGNFTYQTISLTETASTATAQNETSMTEGAGDFSESSITMTEEAGTMIDEDVSS